MSLVRGALRRPVTVAMICLAAALTGLVGLQVIPLQLLPSGFEEPGMTLVFPYPNADPLSVERDVARPVEEALGTVAELEEIDVRCSENRARFRLTFGGRTDMAIAALEVRDRLERLRPELPREAQRFMIWRHSAENFPDMAFGALLPDDTGVDGFELLERRLLPAIARIDGVAAVDTWGGVVDRQVRVELDESRVKAHGVDLYELVGRLQTESFSLPAGTIDDGGRRLFVRSAAPVAGLEDLESYPVSEGLVVGDLGDAYVEHAYRDRVSRMDGKSIVWIVVRRESGRNTVEVCRDVRAAIAGFAGDPVLSSFTMLPMWDAGESIEAALGELEGSILWGGLLAIAVLFVFFREWRATLVIAAAIPFSVLVSLALLALFGYTLNVLTLAGLTLAVGMLVDNAIVVVENVLRRRELGEDVAEAAAHGSGEVALAITLATLTSIVVFLPLVFVADEPAVRVMISNLAGPISFGLLASLATALLVVPLFAARLRTGSAAGAGGGSDRGPLAWFRRRAVEAAGWALDRRVEALVLLALLIGGGGWWLSQHVERAPEESGIREELDVRVELDASTTLSEANDVFSYYERFLIPRKDELGAKHIQVRFDNDGGRIELTLKPAGEREPTDAIRDRLKDILPELPGVKLRYHGRGRDGGEEEGEGGGGGIEITVALSGPDTEVLFDLADALKARLVETGAFAEVSDGLGEGTREVRVELDREAVSRAGAAPNMVLGVLGYQLRGSRLPDLRLGDEDVPVVLSFGEPEQGEGVAWLRSMPIRTATGQTALEALAEVTTGRGPQSIRRVDRKTRVEVVASAGRDEAWRAHQVAQQVMATFALPEGVSYEVGGAFRAFDEQVQEVMKVLLLGVVFMFFLMGVLFESFVLPIAVLPSLPFAFVGAYFGLWATGTPQDVIATLGSVILAGIVVNNAIVLVDVINRHLTDGFTQRAAVLEGVRDRFRPVILTATTTVVGLIPMALNPATEGVMSYHSLARAVIGGLVASTIGTLIAVPLAWILLDDLRRFVARVALRWWR